jgi:hypothetical protein
MNIFKPRTLTYRQIAGIKWGTLAAAFLIAHYWPAVTDWTTLWWIVFVLMVWYVFTFYFRRK